MIQVRVISPLARFLGTGVRVEELAGFHTFAIERGFFSIAWCGLKRLVDIAVALVLIPFVVLFSLLHFVFGKITRSITFFSEARIGADGATLRWPRAVTASGHESADFLKAGLWFNLLIGRLSLIGPPPVLAERPMTREERELYRFRPGITGNWRVSHSEDWKNAAEDEILQMQNCSPTREIIILARSAVLMLRGRYPAWFHNERRNP
jgi:lipopolysaccharide/colanic/teichoic acid biosynthesis glycosyltransferase